jgi:hypothetical protein
MQDTFYKKAAISFQLFCDKKLRNQYFNSLLIGIKEEDDLIFIMKRNLVSGGV